MCVPPTIGTAARGQTTHRHPGVRCSNLCRSNQISLVLLSVSHRVVSVSTCLRVIVHVVGRYFRLPVSPCQVFEIVISSPKEVSLLSKMEDYRALRAANARFFGATTTPVGHLEQEISEGNRLFLQVRGFARR